MHLADFDYHLPEELIAQEPLADRAASRMLVVHRAEGRWEDRQFRDFPSFLGPGDCLVLNDSRVFPARLFGHRAGVHALPVGKNNPKRREYLSGKVEVFLLRPVSAGRQGMGGAGAARAQDAGGRAHPHSTDGLEGEIVGRGEFGERTIRFDSGPICSPSSRESATCRCRPTSSAPTEPADRERYQTVFAREKGSVAAPTAGLHFTPEMLDRVPRARRRDRPASRCTWGWEPFSRCTRSRWNRRGCTPSAIAITAENAAAHARRPAPGGGGNHQRAHARKRRCATARCKRGAARRTSSSIPASSFARPGAMLTNFHLPRTSLLLLVCAFAGTDLALAAYRHAVERRYRFYSYGDCMLIL